MMGAPSPFSGMLYTSPSAMKRGRSYSYSVTKEASNFTRLKSLAYAPVKTGIMSFKLNAAVAKEVKQPTHMNTRHVRDAVKGLFLKVFEEIDL